MPRFPGYVKLDIANKGFRREGSKVVERLEEQKPASKFQGPHRESQRAKHCKTRKGESTRDE